MDEDRFFILNRGDLEKRLDPFYYIPSLVALEEQVLANNAVPLRSFVKKMASGATPTVAEFDKYYSNAKEGHPFIRVQNLSETGVLSLDDVKYINDYTQKVYLKRSQVEENDLVTKITGVGRMAVSSVPPIGFKGNINQHSVVIKTESRAISEYLAAYLNSDIGEKLATKRSTGGTRPALDYPALRSIPVICNEEIFNKAREARVEREHKENQAQELLASIDDYLLNELGINLPPEPENTIENRKFNTSYTKVFGERLDPFYYSDYFTQLQESLANSNYPVQSLRQVLSFLESGSRPSGGVSHYEDGILSLGGEHVTNTSEINVDKPKYIPELHHLKIKRTETRMHDILLVKDGATTGKIGIIEKEDHVGQNINEHVYLMRFDNINHHYFTLLFNTKLYQKIVKKHITGATVTGLTKTAVRDISIPVPPEEVQLELVNHASQIRQSAFDLKNEAIQDFKQAKREIEQLILNPA